SSPKSPSNFRSHADEIDLEEFLSFLEAVKPLNKDFDIMLEAKNKDVALLNLSKKLELVDGIKKINESEFEVL
ncbi:MAG TPA: UV damage endonuclease UvsE, partial [Clostridiaceae bacterium]|nr:UV damage endonuclease UvsE [Clostridiaceae bacterium]